ncbi:MAG: hypothetical protein O2U62_04640 [Candidatus Bathyarchaeota archaeon]|nr:hypothetical protein [Candidatus Bathyarchaeota archaeon]
MAKIKAHIKTGFGKLEIESESPRELLETLKNITPEFLKEMNKVASVKLAPPIKAQLEGVIELTTEGPVVTTREKISHYEAIGLVQYASEKKANTSSQINRLLLSSGIKSMVPARLNEMTKRGLVFKPDPAKPEFKLTRQGEKWIEDEVLPRLRAATR